MSTSNAVPIQCTSHVAKGCLTWFRPTARGPRTTVCPVCRVQINRDKTAARKRCVKLNSSATESLSSNQDPIAQALHITQDAVPAPPETPVHKTQKNSSKGTPVPALNAANFKVVTLSEGSKPDGLSLTPLVDSHASLPVPADAVLAPPEDFLEEGPAIFGADSDFQGEVIQNVSKPALPSLGAPEVGQSEFVHKTQLAAPPEESTDERLARILRDGIADYVRECEEDRAQLRAQWANRR